MNSTKRLLVGCSVFVSFLGAAAQAKPTATRTLAPSVFVLFGGTATGVGGGSQATFAGGKNLAVSAGVDLGFYSFGHYMVSAEGRGTYPMDSGNIVGQRSVEGGARISHESNRYHAFRPYIDGLFGRGQMDFQRGGYISGNLLYKQTASNLYGGGAGAELDITKSFSLKLDAQALHWSSAAITKGAIWSKQVGVGVAYRFGAGQFPQ